MKKIPAVSAYTFKGKALVAVLRGLLTVVRLFRGRRWAAPPPNFSEDPLHFSTRDLLFFAYKYYLKPPEKSENTEGVENFFLQNPPTFADAKCENETIIGELTLTAAGDLMPYEWIQPQFCEHLWDDIADDFFSSDLTFANLETPIDTARPPSFVPEVMLSDMNFNGDNKMFEIFTAQNLKPKNQKLNPRFDILSTANNHSLDMGERGVAATIAFLEEKNILFTGTARSEIERQNFPIIEKNGIRLAFIAYTFSMNKFLNSADKPFTVNHLSANRPDVDLSPLRADVALAHERGADFVVLSLHFGNAYQAFPGAHIVENARRIFDECGVDVILGGHPHNVQPMASYAFRCPFSGISKRGFVLFAFGDFVAFDIFNWGHLSVYLKLKVSKYAENAQNTEWSAELKIENYELKKPTTRTVLTSVEAVPVYLNGVYRSKNDRNLRFLTAEKWVSKLEKGKRPPFMTAWNVRELRELMRFYWQFFQINHTSKVGDKQIV